MSANEAAQPSMDELYADLKANIAREVDCELIYRRAAQLAEDHTEEAERREREWRQAHSDTRGAENRIRERLIASKPYLHVDPRF